MPRYSTNFIEKVHRLRSNGKTYSEIKEILQVNIPKSTLSKWCKGMQLKPAHLKRISNLNLDNLKKARMVAREVNKAKRERYLKEIEQSNSPIALTIYKHDAAKIALAMLCLGEASKSRRKTSFYFGNSDPKTILIFLNLLERCFDFKLEKIRCTVQCRADQNTEDLEKFWMQTTKIPKRLFYKARIDPRTIGKPTKNKDYKGVLRIDYLDNKVRLELESLADLVYNQLAVGPVA